MDKFKVDDQKISYFPERISQWQEAGNNWDLLKKIYPIYMEISPSSGCNHRCIFCALDYLGHNPGFLDYEKYCDFIRIAAQKGLKSIMFGGEGEPLLHPEINQMISFTKDAGIDLALTTNGALMSSFFIDKSLKKINWIKISLDAGSAETHKKVHRPASGSDFEKIIDNIKYAVHAKKKKKFSCSIGIQSLLLEENKGDIISLAKLAKKIGVDYFVVKPYSQGLYSGNRINLDYKKYLKLEKDINKLSDNKFSAVFRSRAFDAAVRVEKKYNHCHAVPFFWAYLMTNGDVYSCSVFLGNKKFVLGNINKEKFDKIWEGEKRKRNWLAVKKIPISKCRVNCRMDKVNVYLENIKNPPLNYTFI